jgi:hypothetical protein
MGDICQKDTQIGHKGCLTRAIESPRGDPKRPTHVASNLPITGMRTLLSTRHPSGSPSGAARKPFNSSSVMSNISRCWQLRELSAARRAYARLQGVDDNLSSAVKYDDREVVDRERDELFVVAPG